VEFFDNCWRNEGFRFPESGSYKRSSGVLSQSRSPGGTFILGGRLCCPWLIPRRLTWMPITLDRILSWGVYTV